MEEKNREGDGSTHVERHIGSTSQQDQELGQANASKMVSDHFNCSICLELVYKPIVHSCGHIFCFWCVHRTMNEITWSCCPLCRRAFMHFPRVCEQLHFFLSKALPKEYDQRARDIKEKEKGYDYGSPVLTEESNNSIVSQPEGPQNLKQVTLRELQEQSGLDHTALCHLLCKKCSRLLYKPVVLNCGHVFCQICINTEGSGRSCSICQLCHPYPTVLVCLELDQYLEAAFPLEYATRHQEVYQQETGSTHRHEASSSATDNSVGKVDSEKEIPRTGIVHVGVGCDACGIMPIIGRRFKCKDCHESIGFDLCTDCYQSGIYQIGRFNQRHSNDHIFEEVVPHMIWSGILENPLVFSHLRQVEDTEREEDADGENQPSTVL